MMIEVKEWESLDKKGYPRAQIFQRLVHGGDIIMLPDTPVVHEVDSDIEFDVDLKTQKKTPKKEKLITHYGVRVSANPNADTVDMTEYEHRMHTLKTSPLCRRWSAADKQLFLKYFWYTPDWMRIANRNAQPTIDPEDSQPTEWGKDIPNVQGGGVTTVGTADTGEYVGKLAGMTEAQAVKQVNKTTDAKALNNWLEEEKRGPIVREKLLNVIEAQLKSAAGA